MVKWAAAAAAAVPAVGPAQLPMAVALQWICFGNINEANANRLELGEIMELVTIDYKDICNLRNGFASHRMADGQITFGMARTKQLEQGCYLVIITIPTN